MRTTYTAVIERDVESGVLVGHVPGFPGAHSQGETLDELNANLREVISMLLEDGEPTLESEFVGTQLVTIRQDVEAATGSCDSTSRSPAHASDPRPTATR